MEKKLTVRELRYLLYKVKNQDAVVISVTSEPWGERVVSNIIEIEEDDGKVFLRDMYTKKKK